MYILEETYYFWVLALIPILFLVFWIYALWQKKRQNQFAEAKFFYYLAPDFSKGKPLLKLIVISLGIIALTIALVNPKSGTKIETVKREGIDIVFALDVSKSMLAEDIAPNRLEKAKQITNQVISKLAGDRVGLIGYAGSAFPQIPITTDYGTTRTFLKTMNTNMVSSQGTAINQAIDLATTYFNDEDQTNKVLVLLSDGEDHESNLEAISEKAAEKGIRIYAVGLGSEKGAPIPIKKGGKIQSYKKDKNGETVITKMDPNTLKTIASITDGDYIHGVNTKEVVDQIFKNINDLEKTEFESKQYADFKSQYQWFLGLAILLLILDMFVFDKKTNWIQKLNLFNDREDAKK